MCVRFLVIFDGFKKGVVILTLLLCEKVYNFNEVI